MLHEDAPNSPYEGSKDAQGNPVFQINTGEGQTLQITYNKKDETIQISSNLIAPGELKLDKIPLLTEFLMNIYNQHYLYEDED